MVSETIKRINDNLKPVLIYWFCITILMITMLWMIRDFNRYEAELHDYYRNLMLKQNCLPNNNYGFVLEPQVECNAPELRDGFWYCNLDNITKVDSNVKP